MSRRDKGWLAAVAISISDSADLTRLGMSHRHVALAMETTATFLLAFGYRLAYGGDLRRDGFAEQLFELVNRYDRTPWSQGRRGVIDYLSWSEYASLSRDDYHDLSLRLGNSAEVKCLAQNGTVLENLGFPETRVEDRREIAASLTAMRRTMLRETSARIVLGGSVEDYAGSMPDVAEEALLTMQAGRPLYVVGGFGGCARHIGETLGIVPPRKDMPLSRWGGQEAFSDYCADSLNNGLTYDENCKLANTPHARQAVGLILRGLDRILPPTA